MHKLFAIRRHPADLDAVLLLVRLLLGYIFIAFGWPKIQNPTMWMGDTHLIPAPFQVLAAIAEFIGGMALALGLVTRLAAFGIACTMATAVGVLHFSLHAPFVSMTNGPAYILPTVLFFVALLLLVNGPGRFSLDRLLFGIRMNTVSLHEPSR